jgi:hypothetical protein
VLHLVRSPRVRRAIAWSFVPYLLLAVFADFLHVHPLPVPDSAVAGIVHHLTPPPGRHPYRLPDTTCAVCQWHRVGPRLQAATAVAQAAIPEPALVASPTAAVPESPIPHPAALRGPPTPSFL